MSVSNTIIKIKSELPSHVTLVAVSKTKPNELINQAYLAGQIDFGENYVQELVDKHQELPKDIRWHFIGHLQTNKVKLIAPFVNLIHGVDSLKLLEEINKQAQKNNRIINCLLQIYIAQEDSKFGLSFEECKELLQSNSYLNLKNICVVGFMAMASNTDNNEQIKKEFLSLKKFHESMVTIQLPLNILSFGMSSDYQLAIECGSNMIRIGSSIFGERNYKS
jgi:pyridoxal phosphate enzyme (YggS family)